MGIWQAAALIPGTSRSGNTISGGLILGFSRSSCVTLSLIMSIPTILASTLLLSIDLIKVDFENSDGTVLGLAASLSFLAAILALTLFVRFIKSYNFTPFVIYRIVLGSIIIYLSYI
jgi:undecaprenyl-diphosphatase